MTRAQSRKYRGYKTQDMIAARWQKNGMAPFATPAGAGRPGKDILNVPGLSVEIKARDAMPLPTALRQARANGDMGDYPIVITRHNGQGPAVLDHWPVTIELQDFEQMWMTLQQWGRELSLLKGGHRE